MGGGTTEGPRGNQTGATLSGPALRSEVVRLAASGRSQRQIAADLGINRKTVARLLAQPDAAAAVERVATEVAARVEAETIDALATARAESGARLVAMLPEADEALLSILRNPMADASARLRAVAMVHDRVLGRVPSPDKAPSVSVTVHAGVREVTALLDTRDTDELRAAAYDDDAPPSAR